MASKSMIDEMQVAIENTNPVEPNFDWDWLPDLPDPSLPSIDWPDWMTNLLSTEWWKDKAVGLLLSILPIPETPEGGWIWKILTTLFPWYLPFRNWWETKVRPMIGWAWKIPLLVGVAIFVPPPFGWIIAGLYVLRKLTTGGTT